ncbi:hypothetical protein NHP21005_04810 [Helicobacter sp. NHP21005]|uniref:hypothetical protein n=1 Tax=Helicobacter felistomachi TaxID=3040201 RepID=UPI0025740DA0|nr:hypothetical protein [Helicobacter sp. NHP21005]BEG56793.1 hypothetical protein NHP21005_04810 [Helicobacter sp. NHP21005]
MPPPPPTKSPLTIGVSLWFGKNALENLKNFKAWFFYHILATQYDITLTTKPEDSCAVVFGTSFREEGYHFFRSILDFPQKRMGHTGENERIDFNVYDFGMGFDELEFNDRYLRVPLYYQAICWLAKLSSTCTDSPFQSKPTAF